MNTIKPVIVTFIFLFVSIKSTAQDPMIKGWLDIETGIEKLKHEESKSGLVFIDATDKPCSFCDSAKEILGRDDILVKLNEKYVPIYLNASEKRAYDLKGEINIKFQYSEKLNTNPLILIFEGTLAPKRITAPYILVIDKFGKTQKKHIGFKSEDELKSFLFN